MAEGQLVEELCAWTLFEQWWAKRGTKTCTQSGRKRLDHAVTMYLNRARERALARYKLIQGVYNRV